MSVNSFDTLLDIISSHITNQNVVHDSISSTERLLVTFRYLSTGNSFQSLHFEYLLGATTVREVVSDTCVIRLNVKASNGKSGMEYHYLQDGITTIHSRWNNKNTWRAVRKGNNPVLFPFATVLYYV
ncbi:uncharacterized protein LOC126253251 [Schistocerca nitens]|uniref:uncharacterized protein LOC126253251 n=1 Tax=Schistocerca nitens TaxID=7011 RepID=UPI002118519E|nr:uncharacterized protein LOC126253251 [Schistocerca nitens]